MESKSMKKIISLAFVALMLVGCSKHEKCKIHYRVYYPNNTQNYHVIIDDEPYLGSSRGTNFLKVGDITGSSIIETSAPIELVSVVKLKKNEK